MGIIRKTLLVELLDVASNLRGYLFLKLRPKYLSKWQKLYREPE